MYSLNSNNKRRMTYLMVVVVVFSMSLISVIHSFRSTCLSSRSSSSRTLGLRRKHNPFMSYRIQSPSFSPGRCNKKSVLSMHMGHSHSHHHHHPSEEERVVRSSMPKRRRVALFLFVAMVFLGPPLVRNQFSIRAISRMDMVGFTFASILLSSLDAIRRDVRYNLSKMKALRDIIWKHSPSPRVFFKEWTRLFDGETATAATATTVPPTTKTTTAATTAAATTSTANDLEFNDYYEKAAADRVTIIGVFVNLVLSIGKFIVGVTCHSSALIADAGHSLSDLFSDFVTLYTVQIARLPPDDDHPYGHGKFEAIGSLFLALTLIGTGIGVGTVANKELMQILKTAKTGKGAAAAAAAMVPLPKPPALIMAAISIVSKEWLYRITRTVGEKLNSQIVIANAWHHRSDAYSSVLALISIGLAMFVPGLLAADSAAGLLVAGMICMTGADILVESINQLSDMNNDDIVNQVTKIVNNNKDVITINRIRARQVGSSAFVDVSITTTDILSNTATSTLEEYLRKQILDDQPRVIDAEVHAYTASAAAEKTAAAATASNNNNIAGMMIESAAVLSTATTATTTTTTTNGETTKIGQLPMEKDLQKQKQQQQVEDHHDHDHDHDHDTKQVGLLRPPPSAAEVERQVRRSISQNDDYNTIISIDSVIVNYSVDTTTNLINNSPQQQQQEGKEGDDDSTRSTTTTVVDASPIINVDVNIQILNEKLLYSKSIYYLQDLANNIKQLLIEGNSKNNKDGTIINIADAKIFLDLNNKKTKETVERNNDTVSSSSYNVKKEKSTTTTVATK